MGRKLFGSREVLASTDVQDYLMDQAVMRFPSASARGLEVPQPEEGMVSTLDDTGRVERYDPANGGAWEPVGVALGFKVPTIPGAMGAGVRGEAVATGIRVRSGQRLRVRLQMNFSNSTAAAQTFEIQECRVTAGSGVVLSSDRAIGRQPSASDVTNIPLTTESTIDVTADGQMSLGWFIQVGTGGSVVTPNTPTCQYTVGAPAL